MRWLDLKGLSLLRAQKSNLPELSVTAEIHSEYTDSSLLTETLCIWLLLLSHFEGKIEAQRGYSDLPRSHS